MRGLLKGLASAVVIALGVGVALSVGGGAVATADDPYDLNNPPVCTNVTVAPSTLSLTRMLGLVTLSGATDLDAGDTLSYHIDGVTQDEPVTSLTDRSSPDAAFTSAGADSASVLLRAERNPRGNGRVYRIAYTVSDGEDSCSGTESVGVPRKKDSPAVDDGAAYDSFTGAAI